LKYQIVQDDFTEEGNATSKADIRIYNVAQATAVVIGHLIRNNINSSKT
jgi:hypothetical protein